MTEREQFNSAYWGSFAPEVQALNDMEPFSGERMAAAIALAQKGFCIDGAIQAQGANPFETMKLREGYGYTWIPSLLQAPVPIAPGIMIPGQPMYDAANPPAGSIKVSSKVEDYPPFLKPETPTDPQPVPARPCLEVKIGPGMAAMMPGDLSPAGTTWTAPNGVVWVKRVAPAITGVSVWWEVQ